MIPYVNTDARTHMSLKYFEKNPRKNVNHHTKGRVMNSYISSSMICTKNIPII